MTNQDKDFQSFCEVLESINCSKQDEEYKKMSRSTYNYADEYKGYFDGMIKKAERLKRFLEQTQKSIMTCNTIDIGSKLTSAKFTMNWLDKRMDDLLGLFTGETRDQYQAAIAEKMTEEILVEYTDEGWLHITMRALLPHKRKTFNRSKIYFSLAYAIDKFLKEHERNIFEKAVMIIKHVYGDDIREAHRKDCDNVESTIVTNAVSAYFLPDDSYDVLSWFVTAETDQKSRTEIFLVPSESFVLWNTLYQRD